MSERDRTATVYLGTELVERLDAYVGAAIAEATKGMAPGEMAEAIRKRGGLPSRSSVIQEALDAFLTKKGRRR